MRTLIFSLAIALAIPAVSSAAEKTKTVEVVLALDTSNSMDGLIDSAKRKLWAIVNDLAKLEPAPSLRVALYSYGNDGYDKSKGWVRKDLDLTNDLDEVYKQLYALRTKGGTEYVSRVSRDAINELKWTEGADTLRIVFVCGNESAKQDPEVAFDSVASLAKSKGVVINTIFCGPANHADAAGYQEFARIAGGKYANIDQARTVAVIKTPFDEDIQKLGVSINATYCWYGPKGEEAAKNQVAQDSNALKASSSVALERGITKAGRLYCNAEADLIDRMNTEKGFDLKKIKEEDLPEELKKLKADEREPYLKKKAAERAEIQKKVADLNGKRAKFLEEETKKQPKSEADKAFDEALRAMLKEQAESKGMILKN